MKRMNGSELDHNSDKEFARSGVVGRCTKLRPLYHVIKNFSFSRRGELEGKDGSSSPPSSYSQAGMLQISIPQQNTHGI